MNNELLLMLTKAMPEDKILEDLQEAVKEHSLMRSDSTRSHLELMCMIFAGKQIVDAKGVSKLAKDIEQVQQIKDRLNNNS